MRPRFKKNVPLSPSAPLTIHNLRTKLLLTKSELAEKSGLSIRTIQNIEAGRKSRVQEKTLHLLADALEVDISIFIDTADDNGRNLNTASNHTHYLRNRLIIIAASIVVLSTATTALWAWSTSNATWTVEDHQLVVKDVILGTKLWDTGIEPIVNFCIDSPWTSGHLLIGLNSKTDKGGRLLCLDRANADTIWIVEPDIEAIVDAFGPKTVFSANFGCTRLYLCDLNGDGEPEVVAKFLHGMYFPDAICVIGRGGVVQSQYVNRGHFYDILITDLDGDGKDEIIATGVNNARRHQGATVIILDDLHRSGASVDSLSQPWSTQHDSALVRLVIPSFPQRYMDQLGQTRLTASNPKVYRGPNNESLISIFVGDMKLCNMLVNLDAELRPIDCEPTDSFREVIRSEWPDSLWTGTGPLEPDWRALWLAGFKRYEAGHWSPQNDPVEVTY